MWRYLMIEVGLIKKVKNKGLEFDLQAIDEEFLVMPEDGSELKTKVFKGNSGLHRFAEFKDAIGWFPLN